MKGIVFTEFIEMVEDAFGFEIVDNIINASDLESEGVYTAVGTYKCEELVCLVANLSKETGKSVPELYQIYGQHLFTRFVQAFPQFFAAKNHTFGFLSEIENHIHVEVRKLYPDAELPHFACEINANKMTMVYSSKRALGDFARGLIIGCAQHFSEKIEIDQQDLSAGAGTKIRFLLTKIGPSDNG